MAIIAYTGLPGSGKSYGVVENVILPALKENRRIITNIPLKHDVIMSDYPGAQVEYVKDELKDLSWWKRSELAGAIVILDELWRIWPGGLKVNEAAEEHKAFLAEHRHNVGPDGLTTEICLVTQDLSQVAAWVRVLVETTYRSVKLTAVGAEKKYRIDIYNGAQTGQNPPESARIRQLFGSYKESVYKYYVSHTKALQGNVGTEKRADGRASILKTWLVMLGIPGGIIAAIIGVWMTIAWFKDPLGNSRNMVTVDNIRTANNGMDSNIKLVGPTAKPVPVGPVVSPDWRVSGQISDWIIISGKHGYYRRVHSRSQTCKSNAFGEWQCEIDGQLITEYSGPADSNSSFLQVNSFPGISQQAQ